MTAPSDVRDRVIAQVGFPPWTEVAGRRPVVSTFGRRGTRSGIYLLGFADGTCYVGRSNDALRTFHHHRRNHADITHLTFRRVTRADQAREEQDLIHTLELHAVRLRTKAEMSDASAPARLHDTFAFPTSSSVPPDATTSIGSVI